MNNTNVTQIKTFYNNLRNADASKIDIARFRGKLPESLEKIGNKKINETLALTTRVAHEVSEADFVKWIESDLKDLPSIKLTESELELIKGGSKIAIAILGLVVGIAFGFLGML
jgi:hypothetical protein